LILSRKGLEDIVLENQPFGKRLFSYLKKKILNKFKHMESSKWFFFFNYSNFFLLLKTYIFRDLLYMIKKAAINIQRMNPDITLESLFIPKSGRFNPKKPIVFFFNEKFLDFY